LFKIGNQKENEGHPLRRKKGLGKKLPSSRDKKKSGGRKGVKKRWARGKNRKKPSPVENRRKEKNVFPRVFHSTMGKERRKFSIRIDTRVSSIGKILRRQGGRRGDLPTPGLILRDATKDFPGKERPLPSFLRGDFLVG